MRSRWSVHWLVAVLLGLVSGCSNDATHGTWRLASLVHDGEPFAIERPLFMEVDGDGFRARSTCNTMSGEFGGDIAVTLALCGGSAGEGDRYMWQAFRVGPEIRPGELVFENGDVRIVYEAFVAPTVEELFDVLADPSVKADRSVLPSEAATGSVPPDYDVLVPVSTPSNDFDAFLVSSNGRVCAVIADDSSINTHCVEPRVVASFSTATDVPAHREPLVRVAIVPDRFAAAVAQRPDLGRYDSNLLFVRSDAEMGRHVLVDDTGNEFVVDIPRPWVDLRALYESAPEQESAPP